MSQPQPTYQHYLRRYFYSGWAFLMPYLFTYLLYYVTKWPVNAAANAAVGNGPEVIGNGPITHNPLPIPCLLHVYWALHAIHAILASVALWSWLRAQRAVISDECSVIGTAYPLTLKPYNSPSAPLPLKPYHSQYPLNLITRALPWALLALLFYIPGVYLEWPSDPWEHLRRINEWRVLDTVGAHSSWTKSAYFIPYSLLSWCIGLRQLFWLDFYYTGICLLLCWQYYRFSRASGLGERASMVFVIIQALLFGNNIFSFYRYYGISSSIYAQLGAVALTRIFLEWAARGTKLDLARLESSDEARQCGDGETRGLRQAARPERSVGLSERVPTGRNDNNSRHDHETPNRPCQLAEKHPAAPLVHGSDSALHPFSLSALKPYLLSLITSVLCLMALTAFNHPQGLGIAGLGIAAVITWRLIEWKRSALWWLTGATLLINALFLWFYPRPAIIEIYKAQGWLNVWYGFNTLDLASPAGDRTLQIFSAFGLVSLAAALPLIWWNHIISWLTILPLSILSLPCSSILFSETLYKSGEITAIVTFHRLFFAIPPGLAMVMLGQEWLHRWRQRPDVRGPRFLAILAPWSSSNIPLFALVAAVTVPAGGPGFNRAWQALAAVPDDLRMKSVISVANLQAESIRVVEETKPVGSHAAASVVNAFRPRDLPFGFLRVIGEPNVEAIKESIPLLLSCLPTTATATPTLTRDPLVANPIAWNTFGGPPVEFVSGIQNVSGSSTALQNPPGQHCDVFTSDLMPIDSEQNYRVEWSAIQRGSTNGTAYLAVAWYTAEGRLLASNVTAPDGAGNPPGWTNGTYSYFGLVGSKVPAVWTTYRTAFGPGTNAAIPSRAKFVRIGALLNYNSAPKASIQLTDIRLWRKSRGEEMPDRVSPSDAPLLVLAPSSLMLWTFASQASLASTHWPAQEVASCFAGGPDLFTAARLAGGVPVGRSEIIYDVPPRGEGVRCNGH